MNKRGKAVAESIQGPRNSLLPFVAGAHMGSNWWRNSNSNSNSKAPAQATEQHLQAEEHRRGWRPDSRADKPLRRPAVVDAREMSNASKGQSDKRLKDMTEDVLSRVAGTKGQQPVA